MIVHELTEPISILVRRYTRDVIALEYSFDMVFDFLFEFVLGEDVNDANIVGILLVWRSEDVAQKRLASVVKYLLLIKELLEELLPQQPIGTGGHLLHLLQLLLSVP